MNPTMIKNTKATPFRQHNKIQAAKPAAYFNNKRRQTVQVSMSSAAAGNYGDLVM